MQFESMDSRGVSFRVVFRGVSFQGRCRILMDVVVLEVESLGTLSTWLVLVIWVIFLCYDGIYCEVISSVLTWESTGIRDHRDRSSCGKSLTLSWLSLKMEFIHCPHYVPRKWPWEAWQAGKFHGGKSDKKKAIWRFPQRLCKWYVPPNYLSHGGYGWSF